MKTTAYIWKYRAINNYTFSNYFLNPAFFDKIKVTEIPPDGIPLYNEQLEKSDDVLEFTAGDFDVKLSLLSAAVSVNGDTLKDFLLPGGSRNFFYICVVEFGDENDPAAKRAGGRIDLNSIEADLTQTKNKYEVRFKVTGLLKELSLLQEQAQFAPLNQSLPIDIFLYGCLVPDPAPTYLGLVSKLNWEERVGFEPKLMWQVYNDVIGRGIGRGKWSVFKELAKGFGFMFKMSVMERANIFDTNFPPFFISTFWRSDGLNEVIIQRTSNIEKYSDLNTFKNYFVITHRSNLLGNANEYCGMLAVNDGNIYVADALIGTNMEEMVFQDTSTAIITVINGQSVPVISANAATVIHLPTYSTQYLFNTEDVSTNLLRAQVSFMALFCHSYIHTLIPNVTAFVVIFGVKDMIKRTIGVEYKYFVNGIKKAADCEIVFDTDTSLHLYDTTVIERTKYFCKSIKDLNLQKETSKTGWTEC